MNYLHLVAACLLVTIYVVIANRFWSQTFNSFSPIQAEETYNLTLLTQILNVR